MEGFVPDPEEWETQIEELIDVISSDIVEEGDKVETAEEGERLEPSPGGGPEHAKDPAADESKPVPDESGSKGQGGQKGEGLGPPRGPTAGAAKETPQEGRQVSGSAKAKEKSGEQRQSPRTKAKAKPRQ